MYPGLVLVGPTKTNLIGLEKFCPNNLKLRPFKPLMQVSLSEKRLLDLKTFILQVATDLSSI